MALTTAFSVAMLFVSCSGKQDKQAQADSDTAVIAVADTVQVVEYMLTASGVGPVVTGMSVDSIPGSVAGLYDSFSIQPMPEGCDAYFFTSDGANVFVGRDFGQKRVDVISLESPVLEASADGMMVRVGDYAADIIGSPGVRAELIDGEFSSFWVWRAGDLWIMVDEGSCGQEGHRLYDPREAPSGRDLGDGAVIGYVGTGLPL